jgi:hypothetical protein
MNTPHDNAEEFLEALEGLKFIPARWDRPNERQLDRLNDQGHTDLRVCIGYEGEKQPHNISLIKFDGTRAMIGKWESLNMSAQMPTAGLLALIKAA